MKNKIFLISLMFVLLPVRFTYSQRLEGRTMTLFHYNMVLDVSFKQKISPLKSAIANPTYKGDKLSEAFTHITFAVIKEKLEADKNIYILPPNSFQDKIKYSEYGYPQITIQKAIKKSDTKYYIKIYVFYSRDNYTYESGQNTIIPKITIEVSFFNDLGYVPIKKYKVTATSDSPMKINNEFLFGYDRKIKKEEENSETLIDVLNKAIENLSQKI